ncbi:hypothetical protein FQR65_LT14523, partial [Abscondita terminalis]
MLVEEKEEIRMINKCCPGFIEDVTTRACVFDCSNCRNGDCDLNIGCVCAAGFWGTYCEKACNDSRWGRNCEQECACSKGDCHPITGYCNCPPGWKGSRCEDIDDITSNDSIVTTPTINQKSSGDSDNLIQQLTKYSERAHYPTFQKYFTFVTSTLKPPPPKLESTSKTEEISNYEYLFSQNTTAASTVSTSSEGQTINEDSVSPKSILTVNAEVISASVDTEPATLTESSTKQTQTLTNATTVQAVSVTQFSNVMMKEKVMEGIEVSVTNTQTVSSNGTWFNHQSPTDFEINLTTHQNEMHINNSHLIFSVGAVAGILATIVLIIAVTILTTQNYARHKAANNSIVAVARNTDKDVDGGISSVSIYTRSVFHAPLPEPPTFTSPLESKCSNGGTLETKVVCNMHHLNHRADSKIIDEFYDHPPSTGSYRAASIPEPPKDSLHITESISKEHLYDEIPCWKQPLPVNDSYYANANIKQVYGAKMALNKVAIIISIVTICNAYVPTLRPDVSVSFVGPKKPPPPPGPGVCTLEVPTIDLLTEADRRGPIPASNGTKVGHSIIQICCSGYKPKAHVALKCEPVCDNGCVNGNCTSPNVCVCLPGHIRDLGNNCIPTCPKGCLNGVCTLQGKCSCTVGFVPDPKNQFCIPSCVGGCGSGGNCTAPNICSCMPGYKKNMVTGKCEFQCDGGCPTGTHCVGPNECSCPMGFVKVNKACEPQCPKGCVNGICTGPNKCNCQPGWNLDPSGTTCQPFCAQPCLNADCTAPNTCTCKKGYIKDPSPSATNRCLAHCPGGCLNGQCSAPNFCICNPGFVKNPGTNDYPNKQCVPQCKKSCINGQCTNVNTCTCQPGYIKDLQDPFYCHPSCLKPCVNGRCTGADVCTCNSGYVKDPKNKYQCNPSCPKPCVNGRCTGPDICTCNAGFIKDPKNKYMCNPTCPKPCVNGKCTGADVCTCNSGYVKDPKNKYQCNPSCPKPCVNGRCTGPDICTCNAGFIKDPKNKYMCNPTCPKPCVNGKCTGADVCTCNSGY